MPIQRMPNDLSYLQGCPAAVLRLCYFGYANMLDSALYPLYMRWKNRLESFRPEPFFRPKTTWLGLVVTEALVKYYVFIPAITTAAHLEVTQADSSRCTFSTQLSLCLEVSQAEPLARFSVLIHY